MSTWDQKKQENCGASNKYVASTYDEFKAHTTKKGKVCWGRGYPPNKIDEPVKDVSAENLRKRFWGVLYSHKEIDRSVKYLPAGFIKKGKYLTRRQMFKLEMRRYGPLDFINAEVEDPKIKIRQMIVTLICTAIFLATFIPMVGYIITHPITCSSHDHSSGNYNEHQKSVQREAYNIGKVWSSMNS